MSSQAIERRPTRGPGTGGGVAYRSTPEQVAAAALTCARNARDAPELKMFLQILGIVP